MLLYVSMSANGQEQRLDFNVFDDDDIVGVVTATKNVEGDRTQYDVRSDVTLSMLLKFNVSYTVSAIYEHHIMQKSDATIYVNGSVKHHVVAEYSGGKYHIVVDGKEQTAVGKIIASSATLYFQKPDDVQHVFSETSGVLKPLKQVGVNLYQLLDPDQSSNLNTYTYTGPDALEKIIVERFLLPTLSLVRLGK